MTAYLLMECSAGTSFQEAAKAAIQVARKLGNPIKLRFNACDLILDERDTLRSAESQWDAALEFEREWKRHLQERKEENGEVNETRWRR